MKVTIILSIEIILLENKNILAFMLAFFHQLKKEVKCFVRDSTKGKIFLKASLVASISSKFSAVYLHGMYNKAYTLCHIVKAI